MESSEQNSCSFHGRNYSHDSEVCTDEECMICNDGKWENSSDLFPPKESGLLSP
jgi:hypothetical protein